MDNDHELWCELIGQFEEEFPRLLRSLQQLVVCEDMKNVEATSHALKGMLSGLSVTRRENRGADRCINSPGKRSGGLVAGVGRIY